VTAATAHQAPAAPAAPQLATTGARLAWLYLVSRRIPAAAGLLGALGALLWIALAGHWNITGGPAARLVIPLVIETGAAGIIAVAGHGPFGETERATGRWLPWLRLGSTLALTGAAFAVLAAGATGGALPGGVPALLRDLAGITGTGLLAAAAIGGSFGWAGPMGYLLITEGALATGWGTPWIWPGRPAGDLGGALCAGAMFAAGLAAVTVAGVRSTRSRTALE